MRTRLGEAGADLLGTNGPPDYPLVALSVAIETGQPVIVADAFYEGLKALESREPLTQFLTVEPQKDSLPPDQLRAAFDACPALRRALREVASMRNGDLMAADAFRIANVARRYSFNRPEPGNVSRRTLKPETFDPAATRANGAVA